MAFVVGTLPSTPQKWALFDLDWTITRPLNGLFSSNANDWTIIIGRIERLADFTSEGFTLGIVTNQLASGNKLETIKARLNNVYKCLCKHFPNIVIMCATDKSAYRKPGIGWRQHLGFLPNSLYCGDACQDLSNVNRSWGYSDSDRQFAVNMGLSFYTPEEVFPQLTLPTELNNFSKLLFMTVGPPGSGKSTFAKSHTGFVHIESDAYKSNWNRIEKALCSAMQKGEKIVLDATNPSRERRLRIIERAAQYGYPTAIVMFLNSGKWNGRREKPVSKIAFNMFWSRLEEPVSEMEYNTVIYYQL